MDVRFRRTVDEQVQWLPVEFPTFSCEPISAPNSHAAASAVLRAIFIMGSSLVVKGFALHSIWFSSRVHIMASGNCLGFSLRRQASSVCRWQVPPKPGETGS